MRIRSVNEFTDFLDVDLKWRKRELTAVQFLVSRSRDHERPVLIRLGMCLLYAHWEGFVKRAATGYLNYVSRQGLKYCELEPSLVALCVRPVFRDMELSQRVTIHTRLTSFLLSDLQENAEVPWDDAVDTRSNLDSVVLQEVLCLLGLDYASYATKEQLIDEKLLGQRNRIAHGEWSDVDLADYNTVHAEVLALLELFRNDVENAAATRRFRRSLASGSS